MALLSSSASLRACARPTVAPRAPVVAPRPVVCRATAEDALKVAQDLLAKGMDAAKNVDANQVCADVCSTCDISLHAEGMHALRLWLCTFSGPGDLICWHSDRPLQQPAQPSVCMLALQSKRACSLPWALLHSNTHPWSCP